MMIFFYPSALFFLRRKVSIRFKNSKLIEEVNKNRIHLLLADCLVSNHLLERVFKRPELAVTKKVRNRKCLISCACEEGTDLKEDPRIFNTT